MSHFNEQCNFVWTEQTFCLQWLTVSRNGEGHHSFRGQDISPLSGFSSSVSQCEMARRELQELMGVSDLFLSSLCNYTSRDRGCQYWIRAARHAGNVVLFAHFKNCLSLHNVNQKYCTDRHQNHFLKRNNPYKIWKLLFILPYILLLLFRYYHYISIY